MDDPRSRDHPDDHLALPAPLAPSDGHVWRPPDPATLRLLRDGRVMDCQLVPWGSNYTFAVVLAHDDHPATVAIYKPRAGETPLWDFAAGTLYRREYAAFLVSCLLGWHFIPPVVIRDGPHGIGTMQLYVEPDASVRDRDLRRRFADELRRVALFDLITNNADRKASHCFVGAEPRQVWAIDHGLTFHVHPKLRTVLWDFCGQPIDDELLEALGVLEREAETVRATLAPYLERREVEMFLHRVRAVRERGVFPQLDPRRNVPYGW
ncbi:MAG: SCO1664 family protein [Sphaerobacter sp.]|nr:SCO1664 family protein [Sphaerobacter sp.]